MSKFGRAVRGAQAGAIAAAGVALSFFFLDLIRFQPMATPGALSGAVYGPAGFDWDLTSVSGLLASLSIAYRIATFTILHFLAFALVGVFASLQFDWKHRIRPQAAPRRDGPMHPGFLPAPLQRRARSWRWNLWGRLG